MNKTIELFLKKIELELENLKEDYNIREADLENIRHALSVIREEAFQC